MVKVTVAGHTYYMDGYLQSNLDLLKEAVQKDLDAVICIDGAEGSGKSVMAQGLALYCDPTFNIDRIAFNSDQFKAKVKGAAKYQAIVYDESFGGLSAARSTSKINFSLVKMLTEIRSKNLFIFVLLPTFFDLQRYAAIWRSRALIHVYFGSNFERGFFAFFNAERKQNLYLLGKKMYNYNANGITPNFRGRTTNYWVVDKVEYERRKQEAINATEKDNLDPKRAYALEFREKIIRSFKDPAIGLTKYQMEKILGIAHRTLDGYIHNIERKDRELALELELLANEKEADI